MAFTVNDNDYVSNSEFECDPAGNGYYLVINGRKFWHQVPVPDAPWNTEHSHPRLSRNYRMEPSWVKQCLFDENPLDGEELVRVDEIRKRSKSETVEDQRVTSENYGDKPPVIDSRTLPKLIISLRPK